MSFYQKHKNTFSLLFPLLLIAYFIGIRSFFLVHQFSYHTAQSQQNSISQKILADQAASKNIVVKKRINRSENAGESCSICHLAAFYQSNILLADLVFFVLTFFYFAHLFALKNKVKISYLLSSYHTRAPPLFFN